jgi:hypothetical protein
MIELWTAQVAHLSPAQSLVLLGLALVAAFGLMHIVKGINSDV